MPASVKPPPGRPDEAANERLNGCPVCGSAAIPPLLWGRSHHRALWYRYCRCADCGLVFVNPRKPAETRHEEVAEGHRVFNRLVRRFVFDRHEFRFNITGPASKFVPPRSPSGAPHRWLDVGCGVGNLLEVVHGMGYEAHGLELNRKMAEWMREHRAHLRITQGLVGDLPPGATYDVISADNLLEHIHEPVAFLRQLRERLSDHSLLVVRVPNHDNVLRLLLEKTGRLPTSYLVDPDAHCCNYSRPALEVLLAGCGFRIERCMEHLMLSYPLKNLLRRLTMRWPGRLRAALATFYPASFVFDRIIQSGGIDITVFARKHGDPS